MRTRVSFKVLALFVCCVLGVGPVAWAGSDQARLEREPWSGSWWPLADCRLAFGAWGPERLSPLEKYDSYMMVTRGYNPLAAAREADPVNGHNEAPKRDGESWTGHCHGWSAAALLFPEPTSNVLVGFSEPINYVELKVHNPKTVKMGFSQERDGCYRTRQSAEPYLSFDVADIKGYYTEIGCAVNSGFEGSRCNAQENFRDRADYKDIHPHVFHRVLVRYIKELGVGFVADIDPGYMVWNHPAYAYGSSWEQKGDEIHVSTWVSYASDGVQENFTGLESFTKRYTYTFFLNPQGQIVSSEWTGRAVNDHPDFVWMPQDVRNRLNVPGLDLDIVEEIRAADGKVVEVEAGAVD